MKNAARFFKALADEARLRMLWLLLNHKELCVCDVMETLDITQSKASRHLCTLRQAGLITDRKDGLWSYYSISSINDELAQSHLKLLRTTLAKRDDAALLLTKLRQWIQAKNQCNEKIACTAASSQRAKRKTRSPGEP